VERGSSPFRMVIRHRSELGNDRLIFCVVSVLKKRAQLNERNLCFCLCVPQWHCRKCVRAVRPRNRLPGNGHSIALPDQNHSSIGRSVTFKCRWTLVLKTNMQGGVDFLRLMSPRGIRRIETTFLADSIVLYKSIVNIWKSVVSIFQANDALS
jgi:hypothetical protein